MEQTVSPAAFDLTGTFEGFVVAANGKRRMALRVGGENCLFKVPRLLRRRVVGTFRSGQVLRVLGVEEGNGVAVKRVVAQIIPDGSTAVIGKAVRATCTIKVCAKKNCWRNGGRELLAMLQEESAACGLADRVEFKAVGCLDRCQMPPNADSPWREYRRCTPHDARAILAEAAQHLRQPLPER